MVTLMQEMRQKLTGDVVPPKAVVALEDGFGVLEVVVVALARVGADPRRPLEAHAAVVDALGQQRVVGVAGRRLAEDVVRGAGLEDRRGGDWHRQLRHVETLRLDRLELRLAGLVGRHRGWPLLRFHRRGGHGAAEGQEGGDGGENAHFEVLESWCESGWYSCDG